MNEDLKNNQPPTDEVDLGQLFNAIGKLFEKLFRFIGSIFKAIFSFIVFILKVIITNFKLIAVVMVAAFLVGLTLQKMKPTVYTSQMLVKPYFDSKYQLINNVNYYNSLISIGDTEELSLIFDIPEAEASELKSFEIQPGPESDNERAMAYGEFLETIDSTSSKTFTYNEFILKRDIYAMELFEVNVESTKKDIFKSLENGLNKTFKNAYSTRLKEKRDTLFEIQKSNILAALTSIDTLNKVYISVLKEEARKGSTKISFGENLSMEPESNSKTKEFQLLNREIELRNKLVELEEKKVQEDSFFDIVSGFQEVGNKSSKFGRKYTLILPLLALVILVFMFTMSRIIKFVSSYER